MKFRSQLLVRDVLEDGPFRLMKLKGLIAFVLSPRLRFLVAFEFQKLSDDVFGIMFLLGLVQGQSEVPKT
jgi:hypothetical protein